MLPFKRFVIYPFIVFFIIIGIYFTYSMPFGEFKLKNFIVLSDENLNIISQFINNLIPLCFCVIFAILGAHIRNILDRKSISSAENIALFSPDGNIKTDELHTKKQELLTREYTNLQIGLCMGIIGYFILKTKLIIRIFYPALDVTQADITFMSLAMTGLMFGYFARKLVGTTTKL